MSFKIMTVWETFIAVATGIRWSRVALLDMLQEVFLLCKDLLADGADMFPFAEVKLIVTIKRFLENKVECYRYRPIVYFLEWQVISSK